MNNTTTRTILDELDELAKKVSTAYQKQLQKQKVNASGNLSRSVNTYKVEYKNDKYEITFNLPDYWEVVEYGRRKGTFPPPNAIRNWIKVKRLIPSGKNGINRDSLTYLISRKIAKQGIPGRHPLENALDRVSRDIDSTADDIADIMSSVLEDALNELTKK